MEQTEVAMETNVDHGTEAENFIDYLCQKTFFKDFTVRSPLYKKLGVDKEISDVLVLFHEIILNFQVKSKIEQKPVSQKSDVDIKRIEKKINAAIEQFKELQSVEKSGILKTVCTTRGIEILYPLVIKKHIGIVCLNLKGEEHFTEEEQTQLKMIFTEQYGHEIHIFKNEIFETLTKELTTLPDFLMYLDARKTLLQQCQSISYNRELDFLALFKGAHPKCMKLLESIKENKYTHVVLPDGEWENYTSHTELMKQREEDNRFSYMIDEIIERRFMGIGYKAAENVTPATIQEYFYITTQLSRLHRLQRRMLGQGLYEKATKAISDPKGFSFAALHLDDLKMGFLVMAYRGSDREQRITILHNLMSAAALYFTRQNFNLEIMIGIATEPANVIHRSEDTLLFHIKDMLPYLEKDEIIVRLSKQIFQAPRSDKQTEFRED